MPYRPQCLSLDFLNSFDTSLERFGRGCLKLLAFHFIYRVYRNSLCLLLAVLFFSLADTSTHAQTDPQKNYFRILDDNAAALHARIDTIRSARMNLIASYFIVEDDLIAYAGLALMREAARDPKRGVRSRVIMDSLFHRIPKALIKHLLDEGVEIREHNPFRWTHPFKSLERMHDKLIIRDGVSGVMGGRNISRAYFNMSNKNYDDRDVLVEGPEVLKVEKYFDDLWKSDMVKAPNLSRVKTKNADEAGKLLDEALATLKKFGWLDQPPTQLTPADENCGKMECVTNVIRGNIRDLSIVRKRLFQLANESTGVVLIETPYLIPSEETLLAFENARERRVRVIVVTSSVQYNDGILPAGGYLYYRRRLAQTGIELYEYQGPNALHAKSAVFDRKIGTVASFNLDPRSARLNSELLVITHDPKKAAELEASIMKHVANSKLVAKDGVMIKGLRDFKGLPIRKILKIACARALTPLIKGQL